MSFALIAVSSSVGLFFGMLAVFEIGRRLGLSRLARETEGLPKGVGPAEAAVFGLLGLLLAFTFSGAAKRFEDRRHLIVEEANAIGTAYLRVDLLPADAQAEIRELFRQYLDARTVVYRQSEDEVATRAGLDASAALQADIWSKATAACRRPDASLQASLLLLPALNVMIDITAGGDGYPDSSALAVFLLLCALSLLGALLVGYDTSTNRSSWFHALTFSAILADGVRDHRSEFRLGLINVHDADKA